MTPELYERRFDELVRRAYQALAPADRQLRWRAVYEGQEPCGVIARREGLDGRCIEFTWAGRCLVVAQLRDLVSDYVTVADMLDRGCVPPLPAELEPPTEWME